MSTTQTTQINLGPCRFSYANLLVARAPKSNPGEPPKKAVFSVVALIPKTDKAQVARVKAAIEAARALGREKKLFGDRLPPKFIEPLQDGDLKLDKNHKPDPITAGHWFINCKSDSKPGFVDAQGNVMINPTDEEIYSGMYGRLNVNFFPYNNMSVGISCGLNHVQKLRDGEKLGGKPALDTAFNDDFVFQEDADLD